MIEYSIHHENFDKWKNLLITYDKDFRINTGDNYIQIYHLNSWMNFTAYGQIGDCTSILLNGASIFIDSDVPIKIRKYLVCAIKYFCAYSGKNTILGTIIATRPEVAKERLYELGIKILDVDRASRYGKEEAYRIIIQIPVPDIHRGYQSYEGNFSEFIEELDKC